MLTCRQRHLANGIFFCSPQRKRRRDHLHDNRDKQAENSHDHRESDHGVDGIRHSVGPIFIGLRTDKTKNPAASLASYCNPPSFVLLQSPKSCINSHPFHPSLIAMSELPQFRDTIAAATETLRSLSSLEARIVEAADLIEQCGRGDRR